MSWSISRWAYEELDEDDDKLDDQENEHVLNKSQNIAATTTPKVLTQLRKQPQALKDPQNESVPNKQPTPTKPENTVKRRSSLDPRLVYDKKLAEFQVKEKQYQTTINDLQRKLASLEDRVRVQRKEMKRAGQKQNDSLSHKIAIAVSKIVKDQDLDVEARDKVAEAVGAAVAKTLLQCNSSKVEAPKRAPPIDKMKQLSIV